VGATDPTRRNSKTDDSDAKILMAYLDCNHKFLIDVHEAEIEDEEDGGYRNLEMK
jgi:hypothetical protein